ncbi:MAG: hypothetical protein D3908_12035 [Candidatus Electrothrix sp. AUS4]|nr:hypothetical protein [Candidatus Electrothrix sp. AUS4]
MGVFGGGGHADAILVVPGIGLGRDLGRQQDLRVGDDAEGVLSGLAALRAPEHAAAMRVFLIKKEIAAAQAQETSRVEHVGQLELGVFGRVDVGEFFIHGQAFHLGLRAQSAHKIAGAADAHLEHILIIGQGIVRVVQPSLGGDAEDKGIRQSDLISVDHLPLDPLHNQRGERAHQIGVVVGMLSGDIHGHFVVACYVAGHDLNAAGNGFGECIAYRTPLDSSHEYSPVIKVG